MPGPLDPTQPNPVASPDEPIVMPKPAPNPLDVVTGPSEYSGIPKDVATVLEASKPNKSLGQRMLAADLPKYAFQLGAGATEAATLGLVDPEHDPKTTGEAFVRGFGSLFGSMFNPVGPVVAGAAKLKRSTTVAGALAGIAAAEIQTKGDASAGRLLLEATTGALFGKFYGRGVAARAAARAPTGEIDLRLPEGPSFVEPRPGPPVGKPQLLLPSPGRTETDFFQGFLNPGEATPRADILTAPTQQFSPNAIVGEGLFKDLGIRKRAGTTKMLRGDQATIVLNKLRGHPDKDVRETAKMIDTFERHSGDIDPGITELGKKIQSTEGDVEDVSNAISINLWEDPYVIEKLPRSKLPTGITGLTRFARLPEYAMADVQTATQGRIPAYGMFWETSLARQKAQTQIGAEGVALRDILKGTPRSKDAGMKQLLHTQDFNDRAVIATTFGLEPRDIAKADRVYERVGKLWDRNFPGTSFDKYMTEILPTLKKNSPAEIEVLKYNPDVEQITRWAASHEMSFQETSLTRWAASHIRALSLKEHFDPQYNAMRKISEDKTYPQEFRTYVAEWANKARGTSSLFVKKWNPTYQRMLNRVGAEATDADIRNVTDNIVSLTHAGLVGFRPAPLLKNALGTVQTGSRIGIPALWQGMKKAMTSEGYERAKAAGMIDTAAHEVEALRELAAPGRFTRAVRQVTKAGLKWYGNIDDFNRSTIYNGMYDQFVNAAKKAGTDREKLMSISKLYRFHEAIRDHVLEPWAKGDVAKAADLAGIHAAQATQWVYQGPYRPLAMQSEMGRMFGQFGIWPLNYMEYVRQMTYGVKMPPMERAKWMRDFALTNASIIGAVSAMGASVGLGPEAFRSTLGWTGLGPMAYAGGPAVDLVQSLPQLAKDFQDQALGQTVNDATFNRVKSNLVNMVPGIGLQRDIARAKGPMEAQLSQVIPTIPLSESQSILPSQSSEEELFRLFTGVSAKQ